MKQPKINTHTFSTGIIVYGKYVDGKILPLEFKSEVACEKFSYKLFMKGIYTVAIKSFSDPKKFYLQIIENPL